MSHNKQRKWATATWRKVKPPDARLYWRRAHMDWRGWGNNDVAMIREGTARTVFTSYHALVDYLMRRAQERE